MAQFAYAFRYIDDLLLAQCKQCTNLSWSYTTKNDINSYWIYPLHILEIKTEVACSSTVNPHHGIKAHFMNVFMSIFDEKSGMFAPQKMDKRRDLLFA